MRTVHSDHGWLIPTNTTICFARHRAPRRVMFTFWPVRWKSSHGRRESSGPVAKSLCGRQGCLYMDGVLLWVMRVCKSLRLVTLKWNHWCKIGMMQAWIQSWNMPTNMSAWIQFGPFTASKLRIWSLFARLVTQCRLVIPLVNCTCSLANEERRCQVQSENHMTMIGLIVWIHELRSVTNHPPLSRPAAKGNSPADPRRIRITGSDQFMIVNSWLMMVKKLITDD